MNNLAGWEGVLGLSCAAVVLGLLWVLDWVNNR